MSKHNKRSSSASYTFKIKVAAGNLTDFSFEIRRRELSICNKGDNNRKPSIHSTNSNVFSIDTLVMDRQSNPSTKQSMNRRRFYRDRPRPPALPLPNSHALPYLSDSVDNGSRRGVPA